MSMVADFWSRCPDMKAKANCYVRPVKRASGKDYYNNVNKRKSVHKGMKNKII